MAIQWADNFDNYGVTESFLLDGIYAERSSSTTLETDPDVGATGKVIKQLGTDGATSAPYNASAILRKIYNSGITTAGMSVRLWCNALPSNDNALCGIQFTDGSNARQVCIRLQSTGALQVSTGAFSPTTVGGGTPGTAQGSSGPVITARAWNHIEVKVVCHDTTGSVEIRVNGVTVLNLTDLDTDDSNSGTIDQLILSNGYTSGTNADCYWKDLIMWDSSGSQNNDFLGSCHVYTLTPDGDDTFPWTPSTALADGYTLIDESDPDDADYISSDYVTNLALQSETIDNATWTKTGVTVTTNVSNDGDGAATLDRITEDGASSDHGASQAYTFTAEDYIFQVDVRDNGAGFCRLEMEDGTSTVGAQFDLSDGSTTSVTATAAEAEDLGGGLWRLKIRNTMAAGAGSFSVYCLDTHGGATTYTGNSSDGIEIGRALLATKSSFTTTYATTTSSTVATINGDPSIFTLSNLPPDIVSIKGLISVVRATKTDGGDGQLQVGLDSNASVDLGTDRAITSAYTYWFDVSELSADTGVAYTPLEVDSVKLQLDRTV